MLEDDALYLTTSTLPNPDPANLRLAAVRDGALIEKPHPYDHGTYFTGLVRLPRGFLQTTDRPAVSVRGEVELTDLINQYGTALTIPLTETAMRWDELSTPEDIQRLEELLGPAALRGASGSLLLRRGSNVLKQCRNSERQVSWLRQERALLDGILCVPTRTVDDHTYEMPYIEGRGGVTVGGTEVVERLLAQALHWRDIPSDNTADWGSYLARLRGHASFLDSAVADDAVDLLASGPALPTSWCHGDLTLENVMVSTEGVIYLLDPNYAPDLYQSYLLDIGKLLQSTHTIYHGGLTGRYVDLREQDQILRERLQADGIWRDSLRACLSHVIRLLRYHPERKLVLELMISSLLTEIRGS
jgi:hypothetical protein